MLGNGFHVGQGIRTFVATNHTLTGNEKDLFVGEGETWSSYPDDVPLRSLALKGDSRAALVPFLAHRSQPPLPL